MEQIESPKIGGTWRFVGVALAPIIVMTALLLFSGWQDHKHDTGKGFLISIAAGECFVLMLPIRWGYRIVCFLVYFPVAWALLFFYALFFIAIFFRGALS